MPTKEKIYDEREKAIFLGNELVRKSRDNLTLKEGKILDYIYSQVKRDDTVDKEYVFSVKKFLDLCGLPAQGSNYIDVKNSLKAIADKSFWLTTEEGKIVLTRWFSKVEIEPNSGNITVKFSEEIAPFVFGLYGNFTPTALIAKLSFQSKYSRKLYDLLASYLGMKTRTFKVDTLRKLLNAENYKVYKDFRKRVLEEAIDEINEYSDIVCGYMPVYEGRKIVALTFGMEKKDDIEWLQTKLKDNHFLDKGEKLI